MNSYVFGMSGSVWLLVLLVLIAFSAALFSYYKTIPPVSKQKRGWLIAMRTIALALLLFVLFEPIITAVRGIEQKPKITVLLDNSISAGTIDNKGDRAEIYRQALLNSKLMDLSNEQSDFNLFSDNTIHVENFYIDSLNFTGELTDISKAIRLANENSEEKNSRATVIFTDGRFNTGNNPVYDAMTHVRPMYIIGIGDTTEPKDIAVESLLTNEIAYVENPIPVNVNVNISGFQEGEHQISLLDNNEVISTQDFKIYGDRNSYTFIFEYNPKIEGIRKLSAYIKPLEGEITDKNNELSQYVRVLKNKRLIALFSGSLNSDVSFFKQAILENEGIEIREYIQKRAGEFYNEPTQSELREAELFVFINFPINSTPRNLITNISNELERGKPLMFISGYQTDYTQLRLYEPYLPFNTLSSNLNEFLVVPDIHTTSSPLIRYKGTSEDITFWNKLPPVYRTETFVKAKPESEVISYMKVNNSPLNEPLILKRQLGGKKSIAVLAYGLYRWKLLGYASELTKGNTETPDLYTTFINNSLRWLSVSDKERINSIRTTKNFYSVLDRVEFIGQVYDASLTPMDNATISVEIKSENEDRQVNLSSIGNGRYHAWVDGLPEGEYSFNGKIMLNNENIASDNGRFSIGGLALEYQNLTQNISLLQNLAQMTGGKYYFAEEVDTLMDDITNHTSFRSRTVTERKDYTLWNIPLLLLIAITLFATEWFIRKRSGML